MNFSELGLSRRTVVSLEKTGLVEPTEIQQQAIPVVLAGDDLMASAETGSGKTAAYALPIIETIISSSFKQPRVLVLVPTRELAIQVETQFERFSRGSGLRSVTVYGGAGFDRQERALKRGVDVIVATPGRLKDHIDRRNVDLSKVNVLVLDEADRMLDMGFMPQVRQILKTVPKDRQTLLFSATLSRSVEQSAGEFLRNPKKIQINTKQLEPVSIDQKVFHVDEGSKDELLVKLLSEVPANNAILVFARTRRKVTKIKKRLCASNVRADEIHGDISQNKRERTLTSYRNGEFAVLVATDVAARGLDIPAISHVVNYDLPDNAEDYVHRIGRTGRAGRSGNAISFVSSGQRSLMRDIEKITGRRFEGNANFVGTEPQEVIPGQKMEGSRRFKAERGEGRPPRAERIHSDGKPFDGELSESSKFTSAPATAPKTEHKSTGSRRSGWVQHKPSGSGGGYGARKSNESGGGYGARKSNESGGGYGARKSNESGSGYGERTSNDSRGSNGSGSSNGSNGSKGPKPSNGSKFLDKSGKPADHLSKKLKRRHFQFDKPADRKRDPIVVW